MNIFTVLLLFSAGFLTFLGIIPFLFNYPISDGPNSGPANSWELILMISYGGMGWYLLIGLGLFILTVFLVLKQRKLKF
ncbi:hypothetical protein [Alkalihalobacillus sp. LMS39]|uniref:hypothetical protein n=1 Tax=Alkalihalobacillus sp. LMS39 TaxID=2924032 RepID=UPI001FB41DC5|nr:hypothetical protein [Alkalihalobacillus sp. LMS39]UOE95782.1 hypothetical protein MM271_09340 [Alkalihalobacillus sp. LMS39]